jgi:hypothetical protein
MWSHVAVGSHADAYSIHTSSVQAAPVIGTLAVCPPPVEEDSPGVPAPLHAPTANIAIEWRGSVIEDSEVATEVPLAFFPGSLRLAPPLCMSCTI